MAGGWFDKIVNFLGYSDQEEELESFEEVYEDEPRRRARAPVLSLHSSPEVKIIVVTPGSFDEAENVANHLKSRKPVVVNLSITTKEVGQRILDFLAGTVFALNGNMQRVSKDTFLFAPSNMTVYSEKTGSNPQDQYLAKFDRDGGL